MKFGWLAVGAAAGALLLGVAAVQPAADDNSFLAGFSDDRPKWIGAEAVEPARELGANAFRITLQWTPGETRLSDADVDDLDRAVDATTGMRLVLSVYGDTGSSGPQTDAARDEYCSFVRDALARFRSVRDVVIWNEPNKSVFWRPQLAGAGASSAPVAYQALLARCYDVLHGAFADVNVIGFTLSPTGNDDAGSHSPGAFVRAVGTAYRASGRERPLLDTVGHHAYGVTAAERPWRKHILSKVISQGDWNKLMYNLWLAFDGTAQAIPGSGGVRIWYLEGGSQTAIDAGKEAEYWGAESVAVVPDHVGGEPERPAPVETSNAPDQSTQFRDSMRLAACQPHVGAYFNFLLFDEARLAGWQSGPFWADRTPKDSLPTFRDAISETKTAVDCDALKGGRPSADFMPPNVPSGLAASSWPDPLRVELTWSASSDAASSIGYRVYRNGAQVGTTSATVWTNTGVTAATTYTYGVRAIDSAGNLSGPSLVATVSTPPPPVDPPVEPADTSAPETAIDSGPAGSVTSASAAFTFTASEAGARFDCALDAAPFVPCSSPHTLDGLAAGEHAFRVRATDAAGNSDPTPALGRWTVVGASPAPLARPAGVTTRTGTARRDVLRGTPGRDVIRGLGGNDLLYGLGGDDVLVGGRGRDRLLAGPGRDVVSARDGARDSIACGSGRDLVHADRRDRVARDCERIRLSSRPR